MKYRIHISYINDKGTKVNAGVYNDTEFSLAEARNKSFVTAENATVHKKEYKEPDKVTEAKFNYESDEIQTINIKSTVDPQQIEQVKINSISATDLSKYKYISARIAKIVVSKRKEKRFDTYYDLDNRVPLVAGKKWQDVVVIDFEKPKVKDNVNSLEFSTGYHPLNNYVESI